MYSITLKTLYNLSDATIRLTAENFADALMTCLDNKYIMAEIESNTTGEVLFRKDADGCYVSDSIVHDYDYRMKLAERLMH